ncbi:response regulator with CheY-like receiver, AAA-type ATPase, and DNA-binding domains [Halobacteroides halobius DSM 5150]|uniref:Stage 0 sporulation protein A homolog n=1 Tax=Halobacteroides halobius (strain ATCC 35273 / DSM 5150 / MD-1) TaxID=748449 RepID=L0K7H3_HALHC|nr:response regulator [Halobacteroides halobius]AGB40961.1 response regulator with CheY-like receiver, AAA-type ATPase, and DNA-binding domains [Halobacteroides halobius DSM 5150]
MAKSVLVVDDAQFMRTMLSKLIEENGYEVAGEAVNGEEAVQLYQDLAPDLVTMDITMPKMDGIEAIKEIMKLDSEARVVVCSAMGQKPMVIEALEAGAKDFIVKPIKPEKVKEALKNLVD